jgi:hypothetical protein
MNKTILVMGSDTQGNHNKHWVEKYGVVIGQEEGLQGGVYAIPTHEARPHKPAVSLNEIEESVRKFIQFAKENQHMDFEVKNICGKRGAFKPKDIAPLFYDIPENVILPTVFLYELFPYCTFEEYP